MAQRETDWRDTIGPVLQAGQQRGMRATELALLTRERLGPSFGSVSFMWAFRQAFGVPLPTLIQAELWQGFHPGPDAVSDEEFEQLLAPWI
jgi:hypothetical protein